MNKVLERQLKKVFGSLDAVPKSLAELLHLVSGSYDHAEEDRLLIERSLEISSKELGELNKKLQNESETLKAKFEELERMNKLMVDRELKMIELKKRIVDLEKSKTL
jgi:chromosome segregation ATPase